MPQVFLAGRDWQTRALLRAQLLEEGVSIEAFETIAEAVARLEFFPDRPALLIADIASSDHPLADIDHLATWATRLPIWIVASHSSSLDLGLESHHFERLLFRPLDLGKLVAEVKQRLGQEQ